MIIDDTLVFSDGQAITADAASTNVIDLGAPGIAPGHAAAVAQDVGIANEIPVELTVTQAFNTLTSLTVSLQVATDAAFTSAVEVASRTYPLAQLTLGARLRFPAEIPEGTNLEFLRLYYDVNGTNPTTGKLFAAISGGRQSN